MKKHLCLTIPSIVSHLANAWGRQGHEMVGNVAWRLLSTDLQTRISSILVQPDGSFGDDNCTECSPLGMVADWADTVRRSSSYGWSGPLHYVDVRDDLVSSGCAVTANASAPDNDCHFDYSRDCVDDFCVAGAVVNYTNALSDTNQKNENSVHASDDVRVALKFLAHFVGDLHQPLHVSRTSDRGGNSIHVKYHVNSTRSSSTLRGNCKRSHHHHAYNLHAVWDDSLIETCMSRNFHSSRKAMENSLFDDVIKAQQTGEWDVWLSCPDGSKTQCTSEWADESLGLALEWAYRSVDGSPVADGAVLTEDYYLTRLPVVRQQLAIAGARLASTLHLAFAGISTEA